MCQELTKTAGYHYCNWQLQISFHCWPLFIACYKHERVLGEFETVMQTRGDVEFVWLSRILPAPGVFISGYACTVKKFSIAFFLNCPFKRNKNWYSMFLKISQVQGRRANEASKVNLSSSQLKTGFKFVLVWLARAQQKILTSQQCLHTHANTPLG